MCGRIDTHQRKTLNQLLEPLSVEINEDLFEPRYNVSPSSALSGVICNEDFEIIKMPWGIIPPWATPETLKRPLINAREETIWEKPSFKNLIRSQRVIIPVNGFYEWHRDGKEKQAYWFHAKTGSALALAGIYQRNGASCSCCLITTQANAEMAPVHNRMPVIIESDSMADWLCSEDKTTLSDLMKPCDNTVITANAISDYVNNTRHDGERCLI
jgi:putative SOS response-associated peptidase YedK